MPVPLSSISAVNSPPPIGAVGKRARVSERKRQHAKELQQQLELLRDLYGDHHGVAELSEILEHAISSTRRLGESTRQADYDAVLTILHQWDVIELEELKDETQLSRWVLDKITEDLRAKGIIKVNQDIPATPEGGRPGHLYRLTEKGRRYADEHLPAQIKN